MNNIKKIYISDHAIDRYIERIDKIPRKKVEKQIINLFNESEILFTNKAKTKVTIFYFHRNKNILFVVRDSSIITIHKTYQEFTLLSHQLLVIKDRCKSGNNISNIRKINELNREKNNIVRKLRKIKSLENKIANYKE